MLLCDVRNRWETLNQRPSLFTTGTDEHGLKVQAAAEKNNKDPKEFVDALALTFKDLAKLANVKYDRFIRTTDSDHLRAVEEFWNQVKKNGYIYEGEHSGWYSVSDETFYPETQITEIVDPKTNQKKMVSKETGTEVTFQKEKNYFFKMSMFYNDLMKLLHEKEDFILPRSKQVELIKELQSNGKLDDLSISRPSSRLKWGIPVPGDNTQTIYVWFDALINYITSSGFPWRNATEHDDIIHPPESSPWPATHLLGKDIVRFHGIYWPCFLMAAGIRVPKQLVVHGHWLCEGTKMSKSVGNVVDPILMASYYGTDPLRFFLCENSVLEGDGDFSEERLFFTRNNIMSKIANLIMRCCGPKFSVERAVTNYNKGAFNDESFLNGFDADKEIDTKYKALVNDMNALHSKVENHIEKYETVHAINEIWNVINQANQLFQFAEPWTLKASENEDDLIKQDAIIFASIEAARISSILLQPIMPELSNAFLNRFNVDLSKRHAEFAKFAADTKYGEGVNKSGDAPMKKLKKRV